MIYEDSDLLERAPKYIMPDGLMTEDPHQARLAGAIIHDQRVTGQPERWLIVKLTQFELTRAGVSYLDRAFVLMRGLTTLAWCDSITPLHVMIDADAKLRRDFRNKKVTIHYSGDDPYVGLPLSMVRLLQQRGL